MVKRTKSENGTRLEWDLDNMQVRIIKPKAKKRLTLPYNDGEPLEGDDLVTAAEMTAIALTGILKSANLFAASLLGDFSIEQLKHQITATPSDPEFVTDYQNIRQQLGLLVELIDLKWAEQQKLIRPRLDDE